MVMSFESIEETITAMDYRLTALQFKMKAGRENIYIALTGR